VVRFVLENQFGNFGEADMKTLLNNRFVRIQLPTVLLGLASFAGFAAVGYAQDISSMVITAERPAHGDSVLLREEMRATTRDAIWQTRLSVATDLGAKLTTQPAATRIAGLVTDKRG
jgi:hypothetical protein